MGQGDDYEWPPRIDYVKQMALGFIKSHGIQCRETGLGQNWISWFLDCHQSLTSKFATRLNRDCMLVTQWLFTTFLLIRYIRCNNIAEALVEEDPDWC